MIFSQKINLYFNNIKKQPFSLLIFFFLPFYFVKLYIYNISFNLLEIFVCLSFVFYYFFQKEQILSAFYKIPYKRHFFLISFGFLVSSLINESIKSGLSIQKSWFLIPFLAIWIIFKENNNKFPLLILKTYSFFCFILSFLSIFFASTKIFPLTWDKRLHFFYESPNMLAFILAYGLIISFFLIKKEKNRFNLLKIIIITLALILTKSLGSIVGLILALFFLVCFYKFSEKKIFQDNNYYIFTFLIIIFFNLFLWSYSCNKYYSNFYSHQNEIASRYVVWRTSYHLIKDNFYFGIGGNNFLYKYLEYQKYYPAYPQWAIPHPHNIFINIWLYGGIISITVFFLFIKTYIKNIQKTKNSIDYLSFILFSYTLFHGLVDNSLLKNDLIIIFLIFISLPFFYQSEKEKI